MFLFFSLEKSKFLFQGTFPVFSSFLELLTSYFNLKEKKVKKHVNGTSFRVICTATIDQFRYIKIQPNTIDLSTRLWGINPTNSVVIPQSLVLRSIV